jgi:hypothetical protein
MCVTWPLYSPGERTSTSARPAGSFALGADEGEHVVLIGADRLVDLRRRVIRGRVGGDLLAQLALLLDPLGATAVHHADVGVVVKLEDPVGVGRPPVVPVAVDDHRRLRRDAQARGELGERLRPEEVAGDRVVQVGLPIDLLGAGDVPDVVQEDVLVRLEDPHLRVLQVLGDPIGADERVRVVIASHSIPPRVRAKSPRI